MTLQTVPPPLSRLHLRHRESSFSLLTRHDRLNLPLQRPAPPCLSPLFFSSSSDLLLPQRNTTKCRRPSRPRHHLQAMQPRRQSQHVLRALGHLHPGWLMPERKRWQYLAR